MNLTQSFNPVTTTSGSFNVVVQDGGHAVVINESSANIIIKFGNLSQSYVPANDRRLYSFSGLMSQPNTVVTWQQHSLLPQTNSVNQCLIEFYDPGENVPETYPSPLVRNAQAAGPVVASSISISQPGNQPIPVITVTDSNTGLATIQMLSNGNFVVGNSAAGGLAGQITTVSPNGTDAVSTSETLTAVLKFNGPSQIVSGLSGTATLWQPTNSEGLGTLQTVYILWNNYKSTAANQSITLFNPFIMCANIWVGDIGTNATSNGISLLNAGVAQQMFLPTTLGITGGNRNGVTTIYGMTFATIFHPFDTVQFNGGSPNTANGLIIIQGF